jgi:hypothetical protein
LQKVLIPKWTNMPNLSSSHARWAGVGCGCIENSMDIYAFTAPAIPW